MWFGKGVVVQGVKEEGGGGEPPGREVRWRVAAIRRQR
jgi:hypothetical protein